MSHATLIILRHGKAAPHDAYPTDEQRPLVSRGHAEAEFVGRHLADHGPRPELVVSSPVLRALTTAQIVARHTNATLRTDARLESGLPPATALAVVQEHAAPGGCLLIAGHNPTLSELAADLLRHDQPSRGDLSTGEAVILAFDGAVTRGGARLVDRVRLSAP